jgi:farnesyl diphosphate synthase
MPRVWCVIPIVRCWWCVNNLAAVVAAFEQQLPNFLPRDNSQISEAMRYAVLGGGKRLRPYLLLETVRIFNAPQQQAIAAAAAIECVHVYSLVHDDLPAMDDDNERRGRPTLHVKYDEATAILAGDALLTLAFGILGEHAPQLVKPLADAAGYAGMVGGQMLDLAAENKTLHLNEILELQSLKTGALFDFCTHAGAILGGATAEEIQHIKSYTAVLGLLFQLIDDLLDVVGDASKLGKATQKDSAAGKATIISILGIANAKKMIAEKSAEAKHALQKLNGRDTANLESLIDFIVSREN